MHRYARRVDANQAEIVAYWREVGATVILLHTVGRDCPDVLVGYGGQTYLAEIKVARTGRLTAGQRTLQMTWRGGPIATVRTRADAAALIGLDPATS